MSNTMVIPHRPMPAQSQGDSSMVCKDAGRLPDIPAPSDGKHVFTLSNGCPVEDPLVGEQMRDTQKHYTSQLMQDLNVIDTLSHVTRERIPERYVHAKGVGAFGEFELTKNMSEYTDAKFLTETPLGNKKTRLFSRFSTVAGERGYPDTARDLKGAAFKLYTEEGNLDWAFLNPEIFPIRDPVKFPSLVHATKRDPASNLPDPNMFWDYFNNHPEGYNALMRVFSDEGTPKSYSKLVISSVNTYTFTKKMVDSNGNTTIKSTFIRLRLEPKSPVNPDNDYFNLDQATAMAGKDPDYLTRRLYDEINSNDKPTWIVKAQIIKPETDGAVSFDATKVVPFIEKDLIEFGKITLTECPQNFFTQVEQAAFNPANVVPGWDISPDPVLQIRLFMYGDTQRYRLGVNHDQLPTNKSCTDVWTPTRRDGAHNSFNYSNARNYIREGESKKPDHYNTSFLDWEGKVVRFKSAVDQTDWNQCREHWNALASTTQKDHFMNNVAASLSTASEPVQTKTLEIFNMIWSAKGSTDAAALLAMLKDKLKKAVQMNKVFASVPGVVPGGEPAHGISYVPPPVPNPATGTQDVYKNM